MKKTILVIGACLCLCLTIARAESSGIRLRFGLNDKAPTNWDGSVTVAPGKVDLISGWRFGGGDSTDGTHSWKAATRAAAGPRRSNNARLAARQRNNPNAKPQDNGVFISLSGVDDSSVVSVKTLQGDFSFKLGDVPYGKIVDKLDGAVEVERTASAVEVTNSKSDDDYPSAAAGKDGTVYAVYTSFTPGLDRDSRAKRWDSAPDDLSFLAKAPGGDQLWLRAVTGPGHFDPIPLTSPGRDIYKSAVAVDGTGAVWVFWSENNGYKPYPENPLPNFDIWARQYKKGKLSEPVQISTSQENDIWPVATTDSKGKVWIAWQGARGQVFRIFERHQDGSGWTAERQVSTQKRNCWAPAIAASTAKSGGRVAIAWDTYEKGDYDVWVREFAADGKMGEARAAADTVDYEARPALTYSQDGALWIAYEQSGPSWGKDFGGLVRDKGIPLYRDRQIGLAILKDNEWKQTTGNLVRALPSATPRRRQMNQRVPALEPGAESRAAGQEAEAQRNLPHNNIARITTDAAGRVWVFARSRQNDFRSPIGSVWFTWAAYYDGSAWVGPILIPHSDNLLYNVPAVVPLADGRLITVHSSDHRHDRMVHNTGSNNALVAEKDPFINGIYLSELKASGHPGALSLKTAKEIPGSQTSPSKDTVAEMTAVDRLRTYRADLNGAQLQPVRGEFHRHTEISGDGGNDGALEDMWRYAIDVASFDWIGNGDHDNGAGREYTWWLIQKTTDAFYLGNTFSPVYSYERSVVYPEGHRNVIFPKRGIRTLPRLPISARDFTGHAPDTQELYKYLHFFGGVTASHTSATDMGTDWRDNDPEVEPFVEIYQGCRQNYERPGAPRCPTADDAIGGWEPKGFVNLALKKGYRLGFESSSDHRSTHISYAIIFAKDNSRDELIKAMKQRHTYAATANILADVRSRADGQEHFLGDEYTAHEAPEFRIRLTGTGPFEKVVIVKDDVEVQTQTADNAQVDFTWKDPSPTPGKTSYYYVRGEQKNGELVWVSPQWIKYEPITLAK